MNRFHVFKGTIYVILGAVITPVLLDRHPVMACIQGAALIGFGVAWIVKGSTSKTGAES